MHERLAAIHDKLIGIQNQRKTLKNLIVRDLKTCNEKREKQISIEQAVAVLQYLTKTKCENIVSLFENTVSSALQDVFGDDYKFHLNFKYGVKNQTCDFQVATKEYAGNLDIGMCHGLGLQEITALVIRLILVKLHDNLAKLVVVDEPLSGLSAENQPIVGQFLEKICRSFGIQLIIINHSTIMDDCANKVVRIGR